MDYIYTWQLVLFESGRDMHEISHGLDFCYPFLRLLQHAKDFSPLSSLDMLCTSSIGVLHREAQHKRSTSSAPPVGAQARFAVKHTCALRWSAPVCSTAEHVFASLFFFFPFQVTLVLHLSEHTYTSWWNTYVLHLWSTSVHQLFFPFSCTPVLHPSEDTYASREAHLCFAMKHVCASFFF